MNIQISQIFSFYASLLLCCTDYVRTYTATHSLSIPSIPSTPMWILSTGKNKTLNGFSSELNATMNQIG